MIDSTTGLDEVEKLIESHRFSKKIDVIFGKSVIGSYQGFQVSVKSSFKPGMN